MEPMLLQPAGKDYLWAQQAETEYGKEFHLTPLAETWECSVHPDGPSVIRTGRERGRTLAEVLAEHPDYLGSKALEVAGEIQKNTSPAGEAAGVPELPILVKLIDAQQALSVQVHPDDAYARVHENQNGKTEMWYVLDAGPGAFLYHGFAHPVTGEQLRDAIETGTLEKHLQKVSVHRGDVFYIPSGTVHAIGAGIVIAEIQESSNVTYRLYDYNRVGADGKLRPLHVEKALEVLDMRPGTTVRQKPRTVHYYAGCSRENLCRCRYFDVERIRMNKGFSFSVLETSFQVLLCLEGSGGLEDADGLMRPLRFAKGDCIFLPAGLGRCHMIGEADLLKVRC